MYHRGSYWNFPKGHIEQGEQSLEAALRETYEEAGLKERDLRVRRNFRAREKFQFRNGQGGRIAKTVILYLAETKGRNIAVSEAHDGYGWFLYKDALKLFANYKETQLVLRKAYAFIQGRPHPRGRRQEKRPRRRFAKQS